MSEIYNLTTHVCFSDRVENEPRLPVLKNPRDTLEVVKNIQNALVGVPRGSKVLVGGHPNYIIVMVQFSRVMNFRVYLWDQQGDQPYSAAFATRAHKFELEQKYLEELKSG